MKTLQINTSIIDGYIGLLNNLSPSNKLELISKLSKSVKNDKKIKKSVMKESFGAFESTKSAEEIIDEIKSNRVFKRKIELF